MATVTTTRRPAGADGATDRDSGGFRQRLFDALTESIAEIGYRKTTVADIVRRAHTSRRTFYEHFSDKEACFVALLTKAGEETVQQISAAVDPKAPWETQIRQAVTAWIASAETTPTLTLSWIRELPSLGAASHDLQRAAMEAFITMVHTLCDTDELRAAGISPVPRELAVVLVGGLRELMATTVEDGRSVGDITDMAIRATFALLGPRT